eukprot:13347952-Heterocapsa_arctica.AAC.1
MAAKKKAAMKKPAAYTQNLDHNMASYTGGPDTDINAFLDALPKDQLQAIISYLYNSLFKSGLAKGCPSQYYNDNCI